MIYIETPISEKPDKYDYSSNTQVTTICAKELRGEAGCKEVCDECKRKMQEELKEFDSYLTETRNSFVKAITEVYPHEERLDDYARSTIRVAAEDILIAFDQLRDRFAAVSTEAEGWTRVVLLKELSKEQGIPLDRLMMGFMNNYLYVWDYDSGRHPGDQFRVIKILQ